MKMKSFKIGDYVIGKTGNLIKIFIEPGSDAIVFGENIDGKMEYALKPSQANDPWRWLTELGYTKKYIIERWPDILSGGGKNA